MLSREERNAAAETLRALHRQGSPLLLPNVWDAASARIVERAGFPAIATTSAGIAFAEGYPDGERIPPDRMVEAVARICAAVSVPVTADMEAGYASSPEGVRDAAAAVLDAGAVGLNLEDSEADESVLVDAALHAGKVRAVRSVGEELGVRIVINARTDVYFVRRGSAEERLEEAVVRGKAYRDAGADCVFVPGVSDPAVIGALVRRLDCPVNVLAGAGSPSVRELARLGVARISLGSGPMRAAMTLLQRLCEELSTAGTYSALEGVVPHAEMNALMGRT